MIQNVGLVSTSSTPPLGEGVAPLDGTGGDGSPSVAGRGSAEGGPGAVRWYGGQWLIPYAGTPGTTIQNVSCDVIPNASSTDLIELVGSAGVIGSVTVPAVTGVTIRAWITRTHVVADGEVITMRHSPRDSATGAWTSGVQQTTIVGCAVNARLAALTTVSVPLPVIADAAPANTSYFVNTSPDGRNGIAVALRGIPVGSTIVAARAKLADSAGHPVTFALMAKEMPGLAPPTWASKASAASAGTGAVQSLSIAASYVVPSFTETALWLTGSSVGLTAYAIEVDFQ